MGMVVAINGELVNKMNDLLILAIFFKPKRLKDPWEHKKGFKVSIESKTALNIIENKRNDFRYAEASEPNYLENLDYELLRKRAEERLFEIESSANNYVEAFCIAGGLFIGIYAFELLFVIWNYPSKEPVTLFLILTAIIAFLYYVYRRKKTVDSYLVKDFLNIEDAIYKIDYGESQYQARRNNKQ